MNIFKKDKYADLRKYNFYVKHKISDELQEKANLAPYYHFEFDLEELNKLLDTIDFIWMNFKYEQLNLFENDKHNEKFINDFNSQFKIAYKTNDVEYIRQNKQIIDRFIEQLDYMKNEKCAITLTLNLMKLSDKNNSSYEIVEYVHEFGKISTLKQFLTVYVYVEWYNECVMKYIKFKNEMETIPLEREMVHKYDKIHSNWTTFENN